MSNVTIFVGNGLDISLKMETSYRDFYAYVKKNSLHPENKIYKSIAKESPEWWADFELGLGRFTNEIEHMPENEREQWSQNLNEELDEIKRDLKNYIKEKNNKADEKIANIKFSTKSIYEGLEDGQVSNVQRFFPSSPPTAIRFVTLNYTDVLEKIFKTTGMQTIGQNYFVAEPMHHIHGSIKRKISLGVSDDSQISQYIDSSEKDFLIKPNIIRLINDRRIEIMDKYIKAANLIVLYGLSIGDTDKYIWTKIVNWLGDGDKLLIIHHYEKGLEIEDLTERESLKLEERIKNKLLNHTDVSAEVKSRLKNKIYIIPNSTSIFAQSKKITAPQTTIQLNTDAR